LSTTCAVFIFGVAQRERKKRKEGGGDCRGFGQHLGREREKKTSMGKEQGGLHIKDLIETEKGRLWGGGVGLQKAQGGEKKGV